MGAHPDSGSCRRDAHPRYRSTEWTPLQASTLQLIAFFLLPQSCALWAGEGLSWVAVEDRAALFLFILGINLCFCFIIFFLLFLCILVCVSGIVWANHVVQGNVVTHTGLGKGAQKIIPFSHSQTWALQLGFSKELWKIYYPSLAPGNSESFWGPRDLHFKKHLHGFCWVAGLGSSKPVYLQPMSGVHFNLPGM